MTDSLIPTGKTVVKKKAKVEKPSATILAFREYERVSWYLATQGVFDFALDDEARGMLHESFTGDDMSAEINLCIANRIAPDEGISYKIPKGDHIDGLAVRTNAYVAHKEKTEKKKKPVKKQAASNDESLIPS